MAGGLRNHRITSKYDHRVTLFQFGQFFVFSLSDFQIVGWRIPPARRTKEANLAASAINKSSPATASFHFGELLFHSQDWFPIHRVRDRFVSAYVSWQATESLRRRGLGVLITNSQCRSPRQFPRAFALRRPQSCQKQEEEKADNNLFAVRTVRPLVGKLHGDIMQRRTGFLLTPVRVQAFKL